MEGLGIAANVIAVVDLSVKVTALCVDYGKGVKNAKNDIVRLHLEVAGLQSAANGVQELLRGPSSGRLKTSEQLCNAVGHCQSQLQALFERLHPRTAPEALTPVSLRALKWPFQSKEVEKIVQDIGRSAQVMNQALQVDQTNLLFDLDRRAVLGRLENEVAKGASFDSHAEEHNPTCLPNTRVEILQQISGWVLDPVAEAVFWLNGMAGTGKSTISRTIAQTFSGTGHLGASFFFKKGESDRGNMSKFVSTIVADLTRRVPATARHVKAVMEDDPGILRRTMKEQFERLLWRPVSMLSIDSANRGPIVIVVDALDECENEDDIRAMIRLFSRARTLLTVRLKVFLTSRPELPIRMGFSRIKGRYQDFILHDIPMPAIEHDIGTFLAHEMGRIREEYNSLVSQELHLARDWPGPAKTNALVKMATPLFIAASTICRFIAEARIGPPDKLLERILGSQVGQNGSRLGAIYRPILDNLVTGTFDQREEIIQDFRSVVGTMVILASPLSISSLASMLRITRRDVERRLAMLHSVLSIPETTDAPVRMLHLSFRDVLVDPSQRAENPFWVDEKKTHQEMVAHCLRAMECLRRDMCDVQAPGTPRSAIDYRKIEACLPPEVQYACQYWVYHIQNSGNHAGDCKAVYSFLSRHFLHWIESLSLIGRARESVDLIITLQSFYKYGGDRQLSEFLDDAMRFVLANISAIDCTPLQMYSSLLLFSPSTSKIRTAFRREIPRWVSLEPKVDDDWGRCLQTLEGHEDRVATVAFSHDAALVASGSLDYTVRIWRIANGECAQMLKAHVGHVTTVAFSHDSVLLASGSSDTTIRIWHTATGECVQKLKGHSAAVICIAFTQNSALLVSGSVDNTLRIWQINKGTCLQTLECHGDRVTSVAFSSDLTLVASGSCDHTIRLWRLNTGRCVQVLKGHDGAILSMTFSHDLRFVSSGSTDNTVRIWRIDTGECLQTLKCHEHWVTSVIFSDDSALVVSGSGDKSIRIWHRTGQCMQTLRGHGDGVTSIACSQNSALVASGSIDKTVRIWRISMAECKETLECHRGWVRSVVFSSDLALVASGSGDNTIRIWRTYTGECVRTFEGHSDSVLSVAFSHDSALVASGSRDRSARIWCTKTGKCMQTLEGHHDRVVSVAVSYDSTLVASGSAGKTIRIWHVQTGDCIQMLQGHGGGITSLMFSCDSELLASSSVDMTARTWCIDTGKCVEVKEVGYVPSQISFESGPSCQQIGSCPVAGRGNFLSSSAVKPTATSSSGFRPTCGISKDGCWITKDERNMLWLPTEYRPFAFALAGYTLAIGSRSGRVIIVGLSPDDT